MWKSCGRLCEQVGEKVEENYVESQANNNIYAKGVEKSGFSTKFSKVIQVVLHNKKVDSSL